MTPLNFAEMWQTVLILVFFNIVASEKVSYENYALYKVHPTNEDHVAFLKDLQETDEDLDFWKPANAVGDFVSVVSPPEKREHLEHALAKRSIYTELMQKNIQDAFDAQLFMRRKRHAQDYEIYWTNYQSLEDIYGWFEHLASTHRDIVTLTHIGTSFEGRNITGIKISRGNPNRAFILQAGDIGADWLSPTVLTYFVDQLVRGTDREARTATQEFEWHIIPVINPDGFQFTQDSVRLWVKNRRPVTSNAIGVDLTKNWNSQWGVSGGSHTPSADNFIGIGPFSEIETRALSRYIDTVGPRLSGFLSFKSFGQRLVIPFAHTTEPLYNYNEMITIGRRAMGSMAVKYNTHYSVGTSKEVFDGATGSIVDWVKHRYNPPIAATFYLRDEGTWGYTLPVVQITPTCEETYDSLMAILREARFINVI